MKALQILFFVLLSLVTTAQVHLQTGAVQYGYPVINYSDSKNGLSINVSLQYTSGRGIKVNEVASEVGLGWSLMAGGFIQRIQHGEADDQNSTDQFPIFDICTSNNSFNSTDAFNILGQYGSFQREYVQNYFPNGYLYSEYPVINGLTSCATPFELAISPRFETPNTDFRTWRRSRRSLADRMQDVFQFNFNGRTGSFYIGKDGSVLTTVDSKLKISFFQENMSNQNIRTRISKFSIVDELGIEYLFNAYEQSEVQSWKPTQEAYEIQAWSIYNSSSGPSFRVMRGEPKGKFTIQKWYLTEIKNPRTNQKIILNYSDVNYDYIAGMNIVGGINIQTGYPETINSIMVTEERTILKSKQISSILTPDGYKIDFLYQTPVIRVDEGGQNNMPLTEVRYSYNSSQISKWKFDYRYFYKSELKTLTEGNAMPIDDRRFLRLCLVSVQKCGAGESVCLNKTEFDYFRGSGLSNEYVPPVRCLAQDYWGYYTLPIDQSINSSQFPAKAYYTYYLNNYANVRHPNSDFTQLGIIKKIKSPDGGYIEYEYELNRDINGITSLNNIPGCVGGVRVKKIHVSDGEISPKITTTEYRYLKVNGTSSGWGHEPFVNSITNNVVIYPGSEFTFDGNEGDDYSGVPRNMTSLYIPAENQIAYHGIQFLLNPIGATIALFIEAISGLFAPAPQIEYKTTKTKFFYPISTMNPIANQYSTVTELQYLNGIANGSITYEFSDPTYFGTSIQPLSFPYEPKMRYAIWKYGLLLKKSVYDNSTQPKLQFEESFVYNTGLLENEFVSNNYRSIKVEPTLTRSLPRGQVVTEPTDLAQKVFFPLHGRVELIQKKVKTYQANGLYNELITDYSYDPHNYMVKEVVTQNSNGDKIGEKVYYPLNYPQITGGALEAMRTQNMIGLPITKLTWKQDAGTITKKVLNATVTEYVQIANLDYKPFNTYNSEIAEPTTSVITDDASVVGNLLNYPFLKLQSSITYNNKGNPIEQKGRGNKYSAIIYDYNNSLPVATVINSKAADVAYTSFETNTTTDTWVYPVASVTNQQAGITGSYSLLLSNGNTVFTNNYMTPNISYKISFWVKGNKPQFSATPPYSTSATITDNVGLRRSVLGWNFYEGTITINSSVVSKIVISPPAGTSIYIDELRLYPSYASMSSVTYHPGVGKTAECDINNRLTFYQYDALGRLIAIRNEQWDIIKAFEYNQKQ